MKVALSSKAVCWFSSRESPIQGDRNGDECSGMLYEASGAGRNTAQRLGKYGKEWIRAPK